MTNTEAPFQLSPTDSSRLWKRSTIAVSTLAWVSDSLPHLRKRVDIGRLSTRRYESVMDLVAHGLVERRNYVGGAMDGVVELSLTPLGLKRLVAATHLVTGQPTGLEV